MPDREKVVRGLEKLHENCGCINVCESDCRTCPYKEVDGCCDQIIVDAIALLKAQEPREMTEQEMRDAEPGAVIYCEQRDEVRTYLTPLIKYDDGVFENRFLGAEPEATQLPNVRFWTSRPSKEEMEATSWEP